MRSKQKSKNICNHLFIMLIMTELSNVDSTDPIPSTKLLKKLLSTFIPNMVNGWFE